MNEIRLYGTVGSSFWDEEYFTARQVLERLDGMSGPLTVRINSGGGIATEGQAIYTALRGYQGEVHVIIEGVAASAASLIAMAGDSITMTLGAIMMIHDPASWYVEGRGTEDDHLHAAAGLRVLANAYAGVYARRASIGVDDARAIMRAETYYDGAAAVAAGFATAAEDDGEALAPAAFDYRIYGHAPEQLLVAAGIIQRQRPVAAVVAMMAGAAIPTATRTKGNTMGKSNVTAATAAEEEDRNDADEEAQAATGDEAEATAAGADQDEDQNGDAAAAALTADAVAILNMCARNGQPATRALDMINRGLTSAQALAEVQNAAGQAQIRNRGPRAQILRDERDTRRTGMTQALVAQMQGDRQVSGPAAAYMGMSIVEMAAAAIGHRGPTRSWGDREQVLMQAMHVTSDFPGILENALNKQLLDKYELAQPTYRQIARKRNFKDFRPVPLLRTGDFPTLKPVAESGEIKWGTFGESREQALISSYGIGMTISRQALINDDLGAIDEVLSNYGQTVAIFEEQTFYAFALSAVMSDGNAIFHASHNNLASGGAASAINAVAVAAGRAAMRKQKSIDGNTLNIAPNILLVGPNKELEAEMLVAQIAPTSSANVNPFSGRLTVVVTPEITDNAWYLLSAANPAWIYGYLEGSEAPRLRADEPFGRQGWSMTLEHDFGLGAADFRPAYKNAGA